jgi:hypothetical protein
MNARDLQKLKEKKKKSLFRKPDPYVSCYKLKQEEMEINNS